MKANELRIGNYVDNTLLHKYSNVIISEIHSNLIISTYGEYLELDYIEPIPLTEDWLLKFGFEKPKFCGFYQSDYIVELNDRFVINDRKDGFFYVDAPNLCIESVHQLQNLYFALTGEELKINRYEKL